jgi:hypothetical protein
VPLLLLPLAAILLPLILVVSLPFTLVQRYRAGTARRPGGRGWLAAINVFSLVLSVAFFLLSATISNFWIPHALPYSALGLLAGCFLGLIGLALTRWETAPNSLHFTPNRWLVLAITVAVAARIAFGFWRAWHAWHTSAGAQDWLTQSGLAGSMGAGALVLGYYLSFWTGIWLRIRGYNRAHLA